MRYPQHECPNHSPCSDCEFNTAVDTLISSARLVLRSSGGSMILLREALKAFE